jgi:hypothetical protein
MARFMVGDDRSQSTLFPERLDDYLGEDSGVRAISERRTPPQSLLNSVRSRPWPIPN